MKYHGIFVFLLIILAGCNKPQPVPIEYGLAACDYCRMTIMDAKHGSELLTNTGKVFKFDSIECLAEFHLEKKVPDTEVYALLATDFNDQSNGFINVNDAVFLRSDHLRSPMGLGLTAFSSKDPASAAQKQYSGELMTWAEVVEYVKKAWLSG